MEVSPQLQRSLKTKSTKPAAAYPPPAASQAQTPPGSILKQLLCLKLVPAAGKSTAPSGITREAPGVGGCIHLVRIKWARTSPCRPWKYGCECTRHRGRLARFRPMRAVGRASITTRTKKRSAVSRKRNSISRRRRSLMQAVPNSISTCKKSCLLTVKFYESQNQVVLKMNSEFKGLE